MNRHVGVFGGTFDPIHVGHLAAAEDARVDLALDQILFVPNAQPPHKHDRPVTDAVHRVEMVRAAIADNPQFALSLIEIERGGRSYTLDTLRQLRREMPQPTQMTFLTGWDAMAQLHLWHEPDTLLSEFDIVLIDRPVTGGIDWDSVEQRFPRLRERVRVVEVPRLEISSEEIRDRVRTNLPIRYYVPELVRTYISSHRLYED